MRLPNVERAVVEPAKVRDYLLAPDHPVGGAKARFFAALGFTRDGWPLLRDALLAVAFGHDAEPGEATVFGQKYSCAVSSRGRAAGPLGADRLDRPRRGGRAPARVRLPRGAPPMTPPFRELDTVVLVRDLPEAGLKAGDLGASSRCTRPTRSRSSS